MNKLFAICLVFAAGIAISQAVRCYVCSSASGSGCAAGLDYKYVQDCGYKTDTCMLATSTAGGVNVLTRTCGYNGELGCTATSYLGVSAQSCECKGDMCNSASNVKTSLMVGVGATVAALAFRY